MIKNIIISTLFVIGINPSAFSALNVVMKEASGSGLTEHQAISEALLMAVQYVNGTKVTTRTDIERVVNMTMDGNYWSYSFKVSPVFTVDNVASGAVRKFQVIKVTGSKNNYHARVRAYVTQYESNVSDQQLRRIAVLPFKFYEKNNRSTQVDSVLEFSEELADALGNSLVKSGQLSLLDRNNIEEMQHENMFLEWDSAPSEMTRIGQKVGADYLLLGRINQLGEASAQHLYSLKQSSEQVRLSWRVIEANTSKVVASGIFNRTLTENSTKNLFNNNLDSRFAEILAQNLSQDILVGLKLQSNSNHDSQDSAFTPTYEMTPGSSEQPF